MTRYDRPAPPARGIADGPDAPAEFGRHLQEGVGHHLRRDLGLPPGPSHDDRIWGAGGLMWR
jgi:hypothetical protein